MSTDPVHPKMLDIDTCVEQLADFVSNSDPHILGPHEIAYGIGWSPCVSYWIRQRRVHLYDDLCVDTRPEPFAVEIADISSEDAHAAQRCHVTDIEQIRDIMDRFLCQDIPTSELTEYNWIVDDLDRDKSIPDPPNQDTSANFAGIVGGHVEQGGLPREQATKPKRSWWKLW